jgi:hypothetical protein
MYSTMQCTVHCIVTLFNVGNVLLCVIYQLNFTVFMFVTRISRYISRSVLSAIGLGTYYPWIRGQYCNEIDLEK